MTSDPKTGVEPLSSNDAATLLVGVVQQSADRLVMFDLDSTLLDNRPRNAVIMREFAKSHNQPALANAQAQHFPTWSAAHSMSLLGLDDALIDFLLDSYMDFWEARFFSSEYCRYDVQIAGAVDFVNAIQDAGGMVSYLTGRNETMRNGTMRSLQSLGFPVPPQANVNLLMKPKPGDSDDAFKHDTLKTIAKEQSILAAFDNEPTHINFYQSVFPDALNVHLDTDHSMRDVRLLNGVVSIRNFLKKNLPNGRRRA